MYLVEKNKKINLQASLFIALLIISLGVISSLYAKIMLLGIVMVIGLFLSFVNWKAILCIGLAGILIVPFGKYEFFNLKIPYVNVDVFTLLLYFIFSVIMMKYVVDKQSTGMKFDVNYSLLISIIFIYTLIGFLKSNTFVVAEFKVYLFYIVYPLSLCLFYKSKDALKLLLKLSIVSCFLLSCLVVFMYFFKSTIFYEFFDGSFYTEGTRVAVSNLSIFIICMPIFMVTLVLRALNSYWNMFILITIPLMTVSSIMGESRTLMGAIAMNMLFVFLLMPFVISKRQLGSWVKVSLLFSCVFILAIIALNFVSLGDKLLVAFERFSEIITTGTADSYQTRNMTNEYTLQLIKENLLGYGVGSGMWLYNSVGVPIQEGYFIDNGFLTILFKFGIPGILIFMIFHFKNIFNILKCYRDNKRSNYGIVALMILICLPVYFFSGLYMSAQLVTNGTIFGFLLIIFAFFKTYISKNQAN
ncbi:O-antigen ligase family protein [Bacillus cereus]|nr:O-antigen ligase family protein [Bacillus cereus]